MQWQGPFGSWGRTRTGGKFITIYIKVDIVEGRKRKVVTRERRARSGGAEEEKLRVTRSLEGASLESTSHDRLTTGPRRGCSAVSNSQILCNHYTVHGPGRARADPLLLALDPGPPGSAWPGANWARPGPGQGQPWPFIEKVPKVNK